MSKDPVKPSNYSSGKKKWMVINQSKKDRPEVQSYCGIEDLPPIPISFPCKGAIGKTGTWRVFRPVIDQTKCTKCNTCYLFCPESSIQFDEEKKCFIIDYDYCKGCGICSKVCTTHSIEMKLEEK
jgi:pyruvate ferredoxin oxidoreductase delta subunit